MNYTDYEAGIDCRLEYLLACMRHGLSPVGLNVGKWVFCPCRKHQTQHFVYVARIDKNETK